MRTTRYHRAEAMGRRHRRALHDMRNRLRVIPVGWVAVWLSVVLLWLWVVTR